MCVHMYMCLCYFVCVHMHVSGCSLATSVGSLLQVTEGITGNLSFVCVSNTCMDTCM